MSETISESLNLPIIGGMLIAYVVPLGLRQERMQRDFGEEFEKIYPPHNWSQDIKSYVQSYFEELENYCSSKKDYSVDWKLIFTIPGPDARYNSGQAVVHSERFEEFIDKLKQGLER